LDAEDFGVCAERIANPATRHRNVNRILALILELGSRYRSEC
jgi:hypothetical protein